MLNEYDYIVVGAGVVGLAITGHLAKKNKKVLLVEQNDYGTAASGTNLGQLSVTDRNPGLEIEMVRETFAAYAEANAEYKLEYLRKGGLCTLETDEDIAIAERLVPEKKAKGYDLELLYGDEITRVEPYIENLKGGVYSPDEGRINPFKVNHWLMQEALDAGAKYLSYTKVHSFEETKTGITCITSDRSYTAKKVVLATGSWSKELLSGIGVDLPIDYIRGTAMVTQTFPKMINGPVEDGAFFTGNVPDGDTIYFGGVQEENGSIVIAQANRVGVDYNTEVDNLDLTKMAKLFLSHFPVLKDIQIVRSWSGNTTTTQDDEPFWGFCQNHPRLFLAIAFKGAFSLAPAVGRRTADWLVDGCYDERYEKWSPNRMGLNKEEA
ncbi:FAD-binding oxidoreductase [Clostridia bacterium]|nr:FAD-binding oxidoreductase [Clostridia bacterium]